MFNYKSIQEIYGNDVLKQIKNYEKFSRARGIYRSHLHFNLHCKHHDVIPKSLKMKSPINSPEAQRLIHKTERSLLNVRISETIRKKRELNAKICALKNSLKNDLLDDLYTEIIKLNEEREERECRNSAETQKKKFRSLTNTEIDTESDQNTTQPVVRQNNEEIDDVKKKWVKNISDRAITDTEEQILRKGGNYALTPRKIPYNEYIVENEKACKYLDKGQAQALRAEVTDILLKAKPPVQNISKEERTALHNLRKDDSIVVTPADKGRCLVVMNKVDYISQMEEKLRDRKIYKPLETDPTPSIAKKLRSKLKQLNQIDLCTYMTLTPTRAAIPRLFGQPKIHKDGYPLREILNSNGGVTKETDKYISKIIKTYVGDSPYYVKNSAHFVESIKDLKVEEDEILVSFDVTALYPSIPQKRAIELVKDLLMRDENLAKKTKITARNLVELYEICVKQTYFVFNKKLYQQISGLAIGAATSGFAAEIYMCRWETRALETFIRPPKIWRRFVDDTFTNPKKALFQAFDGTPKLSSWKNNKKQQSSNHL